MKVGAIVTLASGQPTENYFRSIAVVDRPEKKRIPAWNPSLDILGASLIDRTVAKLIDVGVATPVIVQDKSAASQFLPLQTSKASIFSAQWEKAVGEALSNGIDHLFLLRVGVYSDVDYAELLDFHVRAANVMTQVHAADGSLDIAVVDVALLNNSDGSYRKRLGALVPQIARFDFDGYVNRLTGVRDLFQLVQDGLYGRCKLSPIGEEIRDGLWAAADATIHPTAMISGPAFIGARSEVAASCTITGGCSIERDCKIDFASLIQEACVLQDTYVGVALDVRRSVVGGQKLFALNRNAEIKISDRRLLSSNSKSNSWLAGLTSWMSREVQQAD